MKRSTSYLILLAWIFACWGLSCSNWGDVKPCEKSDGCKRSGLCINENGRCIAEITSHCVQSRQCRSLGMCTLQNKKCVVGTDEDCRNSEACKNGGFCIARAGECSVLTATYCKSQEACKLEGLCSYNRTSYICVAILPKDCASSDACKKQGRCSPQNNRCVRVLEPGLEPTESVEEQETQSDAGATVDEAVAERRPTTEKSQVTEEQTKETIHQGATLHQRCSDTVACSPKLVCAEGFCRRTCSTAPDGSNNCEKEQDCQKFEKTRICVDRCTPFAGSEVRGGCPRGMYCDSNRVVFPQAPKYLCSPLPPPEEGLKLLGESCSSASQCDGTKKLFCDNNKCLQACDPRLGDLNNPGCSQQQHCAEDTSNFLGGRCVAITGQGPGERCNTSSLRCEKGALCIQTGIGSICAKACKTTLDCATGLTCDTLPEGKVCRAPTRRLRGEACSSKEPCQSGLSCVPMGSSSVCHQTCSPTQNTCGSSICRTLPRSPSLSLCLNYGTVPEGSFCDNHKNLCAPGLVCVDYFGFKLCTRECDLRPQFQCPQNHICLEGPRPKGAPKHNNFCAKKVKFGENCSGLKFCAGFCLELNANSTCTKECDVGKAGECPSGWRCAPAPTLKSGVCMRAVRKQGQSCDAQNGCVQGTHCVILAGKTQGVCLKSCEKSTRLCPTNQECKILVRNAGVCVEKKKTLYQTCSAYQLQAVYNDCKGFLQCIGQQSRCHQPCLTQADCSTGFSCFYNVCLQDCKASTDCTRYPSICSPVSPSTSVCVH